MGFHLWVTKPAYSTTLALQHSFLAQNFKELFLLQSIRESDSNLWLDRLISLPLDRWIIKKPPKDFVLPGRVIIYSVSFFNRQQSCLPCKHEEYRQSCSVGLGVQVNSAVCFFSGYMFFLISLLANIQIFFGLNKYFDCLSKKRFKKRQVKNDILIAMLYK